MIILMILAGTAKKMRTRFIAVLFCCLLTVCDSKSKSKSKSKFKSKSESESKSSIVGQNVTLTCTYDIREHGLVKACWGRGDLPFSGCNDQIVATNGKRVTQQSGKYKLLGWLMYGDVSLTILNVTKEDAGKYGCRVIVVGPFNDEKHHFELIIKDGDGNLNAPPTTQGGSLEAGTGSDVTQIIWDSTVHDTTGPAVPRVQAPVWRQDGNNLPMFLGNTLRMAFIVFIPAVVLTAAYRMWRSNRKAAIDGDTGDSQSEAAEDDVAL